MKKVSVLAVDEDVLVDMQRLEQIVSELGDQTANQVINAALEQLALALTDTLKAAENDDLGQIVRSADRLSRLAWQVGLVTLAGVGVDVGSCAEKRDTAGLATTIARLRRIGNRSLTEIWDPPVRD